MGQDKMKTKKQYNEGTYEGMFESLKHNILLMLNQIEANAEYSKLDINVYLEVIEKRIKDIKRKLKQKINKIQLR